MPMTASMRRSSMKTISMGIFQQSGALQGPRAGARMQVGRSGPCDHARMAAFNTLRLKPALLASIETLGYSEMTPVQVQGVPPMLAGRDVIAPPQPGRRKTA